MVSSSLYFAGLEVQSGEGQAVPGEAKNEEVSNKKPNAKYLVVGPGGLIPNPSVVAAGEKPADKPSKYYEGTTSFEKVYCMDSDMAYALATQKAIAKPGCYFHVVSTVTIFQAQVTEPKAVLFDK